MSLSILAPASKSQTQRALVLAALANGQSVLRAPLECDDSRHLRGALAALGARIDDSRPDAWRVVGVAGAPRLPAAPLTCGEGGTTLRFLAPLALLLDGPLELHGQGRLVRRPLDELLDALALLGVEAQSLPGRETLPVTLTRRRTAPSAAVVDGGRSSQFVSALLLTAPCLAGGLELTVTGERVSTPYLELTLEMMARFGVRAVERGGSYQVPGAAYQACEAPIEGDWSGGAFLLAAGFILGRPLEVPNLALGSHQGDRAVAGFLEQLALPGPRRFSLARCPDLVAPLAAACVLAPGRSDLVDVAHARHKESDRLAVLARGLGQAGVEVEERPDGLGITGAAPGGLRPGRLDPAGDHRMAMAFGLLSLVQPGITVRDPGCVGKSYPRFWRDLERVRR